MALRHTQITMHITESVSIHTRAAIKGSRWRLGHKSDQNQIEIRDYVRCH